MKVMEGCSDGSAQECRLEAWGGSHVGWGDDGSLGFRVLGFRVVAGKLIERDGGALRGKLPKELG